MTTTEYLSSSAAWVYLATLTYILGFFITRQIALRILILAGTVFYIIYYYVHLGEPQWEAIVGSLLILVANLTGLARLMYYRLPVGMDDTEQEAYEAFGDNLLPGEFRRLCRSAKRETSRQAKELTHEGQRQDELFFVLRGKASMVKGKRRFWLSERTFVGEVAFKLDGIASSSVSLPNGGTWLTWDARTLKELLDSDHQLAKAFDAAVTQDMARKIALSSPEEDYELRTSTATYAR